MFSLLTGKTSKQKTQKLADEVNSRPNRGKKIFLTGSSAKTSSRPSFYIWVLPGPSSFLLHHLIHTRWWRLDSKAPLFSECPEHMVPSSSHNHKVRSQTVHEDVLLPHGLLEIRGPMKTRNDHERTRRKHLTAQQQTFPFWLNLHRKSAEKIEAWELECGE